MKKLKLILATLVILAIGAFIVLWLITGSMVKNAIESKGPVITGTPVTVESVSMFLPGGSGSISELVVSNPDDFKTAYAFHFGKIAINLDPASIFAEKVVINELTTISPDIMIEVKDLKLLAEEARTNLGRIYDHIEARSDEARKTGKGKRKVVIKKITLLDCRVHLASGRSNEPFKTLYIGDLEITGIGEKKGAVMATEAVRQICKSLMGAAMEKVIGEQSVLSKVKEEATDLGGKAKKEAGEAIDYIKEVWRKSVERHRAEQEEGTDEQ
ncbi:MAG: hypothetical protein JXQ25_07175 [Deltaproteobacteria bacterium]|nr:hypothetical protein [Deltaproteobacteria bacterium]